MDRTRVESLFKKSAGFRCLVVGDLMLDEYLWGKTERISPEAPVQVVDICREDLRLGGAGNVANNLRALGCQVTMATVIGDDPTGDSLLDVLALRGVKTDGVFRTPGRRTSRKTRLIAANQQIVRIDRESQEPLGTEMEAQLCTWLRENREHFDVVLVSDYLKGVITSSVVEAVVSRSQDRPLPVLVDPKGSDYSKYRGASVLTPNRKEAEAASGVMITNEETLTRAATIIMDQAGLDHLLITRSEEGMSLFSRNADAVHIPTVAREVYDVTGAGDTVLATLACGIAGGLSFADAAQAANLAAGITVGKVGTSTVSPEEIAASASQSEPEAEPKVKGLGVVATLVAPEQAHGKKIVFTYGCFEFLHVGHVKHLQATRRLGDILVLGLNSDASMERIKGAQPPLLNQEERANILAALDAVDYVVVFDEDIPLEVIATLEPDIVVAGDYEYQADVVREVVEAYGGWMGSETFADEKYSHTIIAKVLERHS